ncbi:MAG: helix-turn-helix transcriptional regulator [Caldilineaceae bacterium]
MSDSEETLLQRLRESVIQMRKTPQRTTTPGVQHEVNVRDAIRQLSRSRVSEILRQLRATRSLSYEQVRERTGLTQQLLYDVEYKDRRLTLPELTALARCYEVSINDILGVDVEQ